MVIMKRGDWDRGRDSREQVLWWRLHAAGIGNITITQMCRPDAGDPGSR